MSISLNSVNSEVVRAHKRIDDLNGVKCVDILGPGYPNTSSATSGSIINLKDYITNYSLLLVEATSVWNHRDNTNSVLIVIESAVYGDDMSDTNSYFISNAHDDSSNGVQSNSIEFKLRSDKKSIIIVMAGNYLGISNVYGII